jgi:hypothetical protein
MKKRERAKGPARVVSRLDEQTRTNCESGHCPGGGSVSVLYGGLVSGYAARLTGYLSTGEILTMGREVWDMVSDFGSEEWRCSSIATPPDSWQYT